MTWRDALEIGLKENALYRKDNLPLSEVTGPELPQGRGRSPEIPNARVARTRSAAAPVTPVAARRLALAAPAAAFADDRHD